MTPSTTHIIPYLRSGHPALYVVSPEERRVEAEFKAIAATINRRLLYWSAIDGLVDTTDGRQTQALDPLEALQAIGDGPK